MQIPVPTVATWLEIRALDPHSSGSLTMEATARSHARHARIERHIVGREIGERFVANGAA